MSRNIVVDASVVIKWFIPENSEAAALALLDEIRSGAVTAFAPELLLAESANVAWRRAHLTRDITSETALEIVETIGASPLRIEPMAPYMSAALDIALRTGCTVYDGTYVALAEQLDAVLVTADGKLHARMQGGPYARRINVL